MNLAQLKALSAYMSSFSRLYHAKRIQDSTIKLECVGDLGLSKNFATKNITQIPQNHQDSHQLPLTKSTQNPQEPLESLNHLESLPKSKNPFYKEVFYIDLSRGESSAYIAPSPLIAAKKYSAPFDIVLSRLNGAEILSCEVVGEDRILRLHLDIRSAYKREEAYLQLEFCGKHTNAIILDSRFVVLEALRHISPLKSTRPIKIHSPLPPMLPNPNPPKSNCQDFGGDFSAQATQDAQTIKEMLLSNYAKKSQKSLQLAKSALLAKLTKQKHTLQAKLENLQSPDELETRAKNLNADATLALAHIARIKPYAKEVILPSLELDTADERTISLPKAPTPQEAINQMFRESKKLAKRAKNIHLESNNLESKIAFVSQEIDFVKSTQNLDTLKILKPKKTKTKDAQVGRTLFIEGFKLSIGRNKNENKTLLENARADDMWLHIRDIPSSHLFIHCGKQALPETILQKAGEILVGMCAKGEGDFFIDYTRRRFVKVGEGANVLYAKQKSFFVRKSS